MTDQIKIGAQVDRESLGLGSLPIPPLSSFATPTQTQEWLKTAAGVLGHLPGIAFIFKHLRRPTTKEIQELVYANMMGGVQEDTDEEEDIGEADEVNDGLSGTMTPKKSSSAIPEDMRKAMKKYKDSKDYKTKMAERLVNETISYGVSIDRSTMLVTSPLFGNNKKLVPEDILRKMRQRATSTQVDEWILMGNLPALLSTLVNVMIVGAGSNVHERIKEKMCYIEFIKDAQWKKTEDTLAQFIAKMDATLEVQKARGVEIDDDWASTLLLKELATEKELTDFATGWLYEKKELPSGGYSEIKMMLTLWLEHKLMSDKFGFGKESKKKTYGRELKDFTNGVPAVTATISGVPKKRETDPYHIDFCWYCCTVGHQRDKCLSWKAAGCPPAYKLSEEGYKAARKKLMDAKERKKKEIESKVQSEFHTNSVFIPFPKRIDEMFKGVGAI